MKQVTYKAGEIIFRYGDAGESGYSIIAGVVEVFIERDREAVILGRVSSGEFLGEMAILDGAPRSASARAVTDVTAQEFNHEELIALIASKPETARRVIERLNGRLRSMNESYTSLILGEADAAVPQLNRSARALSLKLFGDHPHLNDCLAPDGMVLREPLFSVGRAGLGSTRFHHRVILPDFEPFRLSVNHFQIVTEIDSVFVQDLWSELGTCVNGFFIGNNFPEDRAMLQEGSNEVVAGGCDSNFRFKILISYQ